MLEARSGHRLAASTISRKHVFCTRLLASGSEYAISIARSLFAPETNFLNPSTGIPLPNAYGINQKSKDHCGSHIDSLIVRNILSMESIASRLVMVACSHTNP